MAKITAPVKDFNGDIAGVQFSNGSAETDNAAVLSYCAGAGYTVELDELPEPEPAPLASGIEPVDPAPEPEPEPEPAPKPRRAPKPDAE